MRIERRRKAAVRQRRHSRLRKLLVLLLLAGAAVGGFFVGQALTEAPGPELTTTDRGLAARHRDRDGRHAHRHGGHARHAVTFSVSQSPELAYPGLWVSGRPHRPHGGIRATLSRMKGDADSPHRRTGARSAEPTWLTLGQAAKYLGIAQSTVRVWTD